MTSPFRYSRRVQFAETDLAGIVHFSWMFRYMEEAEHAAWRAAGLSIAERGGALGWPRVAASFEFRNPLHFEDEIEVIVRLAEVGSRSLQYEHTIVRGRRRDRQRPDHHGLRAEGIGRSDARHRDPRRDSAQAARSSPAFRLKPEAH
jgi:YbgC/YbaW family acyl-CoA thioester hydrolase